MFNLFETIKKSDFKVAFFLSVIYGLQLLVFLSKEINPI